MTKRLLIFFFCLGVVVYARGQIAVFEVETVSNNIILPESYRVFHPEKPVSGWNSFEPATVPTTVLPKLPLNGTKDTPGLSVTLAPGEFESVTFAVFNRGVDLEDLTILPVDFPASLEWDGYIVKPWFRPGRAFVNSFLPLELTSTNPNPPPELVPELLLKDEDLVFVDRKAGKNFLRIGMGESAGEADFRYFGKEVETADFVQALRHGFDGDESVFDQSLVLRETRHVLSRTRTTGVYFDISDQNSALSRLQDRRLQVWEIPADPRSLIGPLPSMPWPAQLRSGEQKQFWLTVRLRDGEAPKGRINGRILISYKNSAGRIVKDYLNLTVAVRNFRLLPPSMLYSIYYRGSVWSESRLTKSYGQYERSEEAYGTEIESMRNHGFDPSCLINYLDWDGSGKDRAFSQRLQKSAWRNYFKFSPPLERMDDAMVQIPDWVNFFSSRKPSGEPMNLFFFGEDEVDSLSDPDASLQRQAPFWALARELSDPSPNGVRISIAETGRSSFRGAGGGTGLFSLLSRVRPDDWSSPMLSALDVAIISGPVSAAEARLWHEAGKKIMAYSIHGDGVLEEPETYRRGYGLSLWKAGYDGAMPYALYTSEGSDPMNHVWNDFDGIISRDPDAPKKTARDIVFAYPTRNGLIPTLQYEGLREAVDDVRYVATLLKAMTTAVTGMKASLAPKVLEAQKWLEGIDPDNIDLVSFRLKAATLIDELK